MYVPKFYNIVTRAFGSVRVNRLFVENNRIVTIDRNAFAGIEEHLVRPGTNPIKLENFKEFVGSQSVL
jgi:hypothetical protein